MLAKSLSFPSSQSSDKLKLFMLPIIIFLFVGLSGLLFIWPKFNEALGLKDSLSVQKSTLDTLTNRLALLQSLNLQDLEARNNFLLQIIPAQKEPVLDLSTIKGLAAESSLNDLMVEVAPGIVSTESASKSAQVGPNQPMVFKVKVSGGRDMVSNFVTRLEQVGPLMSFTDLKLSGSEDLFSLEANIASLFYTLPVRQNKEAVSALTSQDEATYNQAQTYQFLETQTDTGQIPLGKEDMFK